MKKKIYTLILGLLCMIVTLPIHAQLNLFNFGPMTGAGFSIAYSNLEGAETKLTGSYMGGFFGRVNVKKFYVQPEVAYNYKIARVEVPFLDDENPLVYDYKMSLVSVNAVLGYKIFKLSDLANVRISAGPGTSFIVNRDLTISDIDANKPDLAKNTLNLVGGLGFDVSKLTIDLRYDRSFTNLKKDYGTGEKINIDSFYLMLGFKIK